MTQVMTTDYHTAGEPFRIVTAGVPNLPGETVAERRSWATEHLDDVRALLCREPRGHADMYGGFVTPPDDADGDLGTVFFHNDGFSTACGHGTIALATWAIDAGLIPADDDEVTVTIDVPSGRVRAVATVVAGRAQAVRFHNVPAFVQAMDVDVDVGGTKMVVDLAYGGAFYASVEAKALGLEVLPGHLPELIASGRAIKHAIEDRHQLTLPDASGATGVYGVIFHDDLADLHQRNVTVFADGQVDRSPCGSGTSARLAILAERGQIDIGQAFTHDSIVGTRFLARITGEAGGITGEAGGITGEAGGITGETSGEAARSRRWETQVEGRASRTGHHTFVLEPGDELPEGFLLR